MSRRSSPQGVGGGGGVWKEDSNSPHSLSGDTSYVLDIADVYDELWIVFDNLQINGSQGEPSSPFVRVNELSGSFDYHTEDGDRANLAIGGYTENDSEIAPFELHITGRWNNVAYSSITSRSDGTGISERSRIEASSPIASVTIQVDSGFTELTGTVTVRGYDT